MLIGLGLLVVAVVIAVFVWNFRRHAAAREAASAARMKAFLEEARAKAGRSAADTPAAAPASAPAAITPQPQTSAFTARTQLLSPDHSLLYRLLKSGLPDHDIFARVSLAALIQPAENLTGFAREAQERRLADGVADFVVCDQALKPVAAVQCGARTGKAAESAAFAAACIAASGLRWVEMSPQALPRADEIRQRVLGL